MPPAHLIRAAWEVARQLDQHGAPVEAARHTYTRHASGGVYRPMDMKRAERLLVEARLLRDDNGILYPTPALTTLAAVQEDVAHETLLGQCLVTTPPDWLADEPVTPPCEAAAVLADLLPDPGRREAFLIALSRRFDQGLLDELGALGEKRVAAEARQELADLGRDDLAAGVRHVSLLSDQLGYDVVAPRPDGRTRRLEVKTSAHSNDGLARFFLSRNEVDTGLRDQDWALVCCERNNDGEADIIGWCRGHNVIPYLPTDAPSGRWRIVEISLPRTALFEGIPPAF